MAKKKNDELNQMYGEDYEVALKFANKVFPEFSTVVKSIIFFGSSSRKKKSSGDIDVLIIFNDSNVISDTDFKMYFNKKINEFVVQISTRLHVNIVTLTVFFQNLINGEPVVMNVLRDGIPLIDTGFFSPLKVLLLKGNIKPSPEAILNSAARVDAHLLKSKINLLSSVQELYLSILDASQATLMAHNIVAPSPRNIPELLKSIKVKSEHVKIFEEIQTLFKKIEHREVVNITGKKYDEFLSKATKFNKLMETKLKQKL